MWYRLSLLAGVILLIVSLVILNHSLRFVRHSERAMGVVARLDTLTGGDAGTTYAPVFSLTTRNGQEVIYHYHSSSSPPAWAVGETAMFLYDPEEPSSVRMYTYFGIFSWSIVLMGLAIVLITLGCGYFWFRSYWR